MEITMPKKRGNGQGAVFKRKDGRWVAVQTLGFDADGRQLRRHFYGSSKNEVGRRLEDALRARRTGMAPPDDRRTVARQLSDWLEGLRPTVRPSSFVRYEGDVRRWIVPAIGNIPLIRLAPADVRRLLASCAGAGLSARSVGHVHATLRTAVGAAVRDGLIVRNVAALVSAPPAPKPRVRPIGPDDARAILAAVEGDRLGPLVAVTLGVGLRLGEALGLRWADVELNDGTLSVRTALRRTPVEFREEGEPIYRLVAPKTDRSRRTIQLPEFAIAALHHQRRAQVEVRLAAGGRWLENDLVFAGPIGGPLPPGSVTGRFEALIARAGLGRLRFHDLRHAAATVMLAQGVELRVISEMLGHSSLGMTADVYAGVVPALGRAAAARMDEALGSTR
jgi:integrase